MENVTHNEDTLKKVYQVLIKDGHHTQSEASDLVGAMQNAGILFREKGPDQVKQVLELGLEDLPLSEAVGICLGAVSACWEDLAHAGTFESTKASEIMNKLMARIEQEMVANAEVKEEVVTAEPKEWIERQDQERRAWAIGSATEVLRMADAWDQNALIALSKQIVDYVKGESGDLHDTEALDAFHVELTAVLIDEGLDLDSEEFLDLTTKAQDAITTAGVRFKNARDS